MKISICSLFPEYFTSALSCSTLGRALRGGQLEIALIDYRQFVGAANRRADDRPYGGGPGMILRPEVLTRAFRAAEISANSHTIFLTATGRPLTAQLARHLSHIQHIVLICGHYEGIDQRALDQCVDEEISIGDFVLSNGCPAALVLCDAIARFLPGVLGRSESAQVDSFEGGLLEGPQFTRPALFEGKEVPRVLLSGDHGQIAKWRQESALEKTRRNRPDLLERLQFPADGGRADRIEEGAESKELCARALVIQLVSRDLQKCRNWYAHIWPFQWSWRSRNLAHVDLANFRLQLKRVESLRGEIAANREIGFCADLTRELFQVVLTRARAFIAAGSPDVQISHGDQNESGKARVAARDPEGRCWLWSCEKA